MNVLIQGFITSFCIFSLIACGGKEKLKPQLFYGPCEMGVEVEPSDAYVAVDGVRVYNSHSMQVPCGQKRILVKKKGFRPYEDYHTPLEGEPMKVQIHLERMQRPENYALSKALIDDVRQMERWALAVQPVVFDGEETATDAAPSFTLPPGDPLSVDYWR